jgi:hypothetical protein
MMGWTIRTRRLTYVGHLLFMDDSRLLNMILFVHLDLDGRETVPEMSYRQCIKKDLELFGICTKKVDFSLLCDMAQDRPLWCKNIADGAAIFSLSWSLGKDSASYCRYVTRIISALGDDDEDPSEEALYDGWQLYKNVPFWKIEEAEEKITVQKGSKTARKLSKMKGKSVIVSVIGARAVTGLSTFSFHFIFSFLHGHFI